MRHGGEVARGVEKKEAYFVYCVLLFSSPKNAEEKEEFLFKGASFWIGPLGGGGMWGELMLGGGGYCPVKPRRLFN